MNVPSIRRTLLALPLLPALVAWAGPATAQAGTVRIVVPFPPGGAADSFARLIGSKLPEVAPLDWVALRAPLGPAGFIHTV